MTSQSASHRPFSIATCSLSQLPSATVHSIPSYELALLRCNNSFRATQLHYRQPTTAPRPSFRTPHGLPACTRWSHHHRTFPETIMNLPMPTKQRHRGVHNGGPPADWFDWQIIGRRAVHRLFGHAKNTRGSGHQGGASTRTRSGAPCTAVQRARQPVQARRGARRRASSQGAANQHVSPYRCADTLRHVRCGLRLSGHIRHQRRRAWHPGQRTFRGGGGRPDGRRGTPQCHE